LKELDMERRDLDSEKKRFEDRNKQSLELISKADNISKELAEIIAIKSDLDNTKKTVDKELSEDMGLKQAIDAAELKLARERENLDNLIFSKYVENRLKSIKPEYLEKQDDWKAELKSNPLYAQISNCRQLLSQHKIDEAKVLYNSVRKSYDIIQVTKTEKEALYNSIRELYNDIQLVIVESQLRS
jgi:hypothetical protein